MTTFSTPPAPRGPVPGPSPSWPTEPGKSDDPARLRSQAAVYVVAALAIGIVCVAGDAAGWGVAGALALGAGVAIGLAFDLRRPFGGLPGAAAAAVAMLIAVVLLMLVGGPAMAYAAVPLLGAFVLGLDWHLVRRLRPLPFAFGFLVVRRGPTRRRWCGWSAPSERSPAWSRTGGRPRRWWPRSPRARWRRTCRPPMW